METFMLLLVLLLTNGEPDVQVVDVFAKASTCARVAANLNERDTKGEFRFVCRPMSLTRA